MAESAGLDVFFVLVGAILVFAMHGGFAFLELGTVRGKNQVNALVKILVDYGIQAFFEASFGARFHDFAGSIQVHALGGWLALAAVLRMGARVGRYGQCCRTLEPSTIPWLALLTWLL